jgi:hypothetical protein
MAGRPSALAAAIIAGPGRRGGIPRGTLPRRRPATTRRRAGAATAVGRIRAVAAASRIATTVGPVARAGITAPRIRAIGAASGIATTVGPVAQAGVTAPRIRTVGAASRIAGRRPRRLLGSGPEAERPPIDRSARPLTAIRGSTRTPPARRTSLTRPGTARAGRPSGPGPAPGLASGLAPARRFVVAPRPLSAIVSHHAPRSAASAAHRASPRPRCPVRAAPP